MIWFDRDVEIRYADTDQMGVVHHCVYPLYCEIGRTHICEALGLPYHELERDGYLMMVADMYCRFRAPARYGDRIYVRSGLTMLRKRMMSFDYEIRKREDDELLFTGNSRHIVTDKNYAIVSLPDRYLNVMAKGLESGQASLSSSRR